MTRIFRVVIITLVGLALSFVLLSPIDIDIDIDKVVAQNLAVENEDIEVAVITGSVTSDRFGYPLAAVAIRLLDVNNPNNQTIAAYTDNAGLYTVTQTISTSWRIMFDPNVVLQGHDLIPEYYDDVYTLEDAKIITAAVGTVTPNINASLASVGQIAGHVTAEVGGQSIANVRVSLYSMDSNSEVTDAITDDSGRYAVFAPDNASYRLRFMPPDDSDYALEYYNDKYSPADATPLHVAKRGDLRRVDVALAQGGKITGNVTSSWKGEYLWNPQVNIWNAGGELVQSGGRGNDSPPGSYTVANLPAGTYQVQFTANQHAAVYYPSLITIAAGDIIAEINARLPFTVPVTAIATSPAIPDTIFLSLSHEPVPIVTLDGGRHWEIMPPTSWVADESAFVYPDRIPYHSLATGLAPRGQPGEGTRFLVAIGAQGTGYDSIHGGFYRSGDFGANWVASEVEPVYPYGSCLLPNRSAYTVSPKQPAHLYLGLHDCGDSNRANLLVSHNGGVTWHNVTENISSQEHLYSFQVIPSPVVENRLYLFATFQAWYQSGDGGLTWERQTFPVASLVPDSQNENLLFGWSQVEGSPEKNMGMRSWDGGVTWEDWPAQPCPSSSREGVPFMLADPTASGVLFLRCSNGLTDGIYRSDDNGNNWTKLAEEKGQLLAIDYGTPGRLLWAKDDGLYASTDKGESWQVLLAGYKVLSTDLYLPNVATDAP